MTETKHKILVLHPSALAKAVKVANTLHTKNGPFEAVLCLGDIVDDSLPEKIGTAQPSVYFTEGTKDLNSLSLDGTNLTWMRGTGVLKLASGLVLGYLSGNLDDISEEDIGGAFKGKQVDVFVTYKWPVAIGREQKLTLVGSPKVDQAIQLCEPKYAFAVGTEQGRFFERDPFQWEDQRVTRFISLAKQGTKEKWHYAFAISTEQTTEDVKCTANPFYAKYEEVDDRKRPMDLPAIPARAKRVKAVGPKNCFFCLSNPNVSLHLVVSIGMHCYVTTAKGPLTLKNETFPFSGHGIIIPISHVPTLKAFCEGEQDMFKSPMMNEVLRYQVALIKLFKSIPRSVDYSVVFWEISRASGIHFHIQFVPVPTELLDHFDTVLDAQIKTNNETFARNLKLSYTRTEDPQDKNVAEILRTKDYMMIMVAKSTAQQTRYVFDLTQSEGMLDLQFPRRLLATILETPDRTYWDRCKLSVPEETRDAEAFKSHFQEYDPTL